METKTTAIDASAACPKCGHGAHAQTNFEGLRPTAGDITVCIGCSAVLILEMTETDTLTVRELTLAEWAGLNPFLRGAAPDAPRGHATASE